MPTDLILAFNINYVQTWRCSGRTKAALAQTMLSFWATKPLDMTSKVPLHSLEVINHILWSSLRELGGCAFQGQSFPLLPSTSWVSFDSFQQEGAL